MNFVPVFWFVLIVTVPPANGSGKGLKFFANAKARDLRTSAFGPRA
jgi:hypothetical protein